MANLHFSVQRMLSVMDYLIKTGAEDSQAGFFYNIGFSRNNFVKIKSGAQGFRVDHYVNACDVYGIDANYFLKQSHTKMFPGSYKPKTALQELWEVATRLEVELKQKPRK
jgi:hypothetical protein